MEIIKALNMGLTFLLELTMLATFGYWGFQGEKSVWIKWGLGIAMPLAVAILWGILLAPMAKQRLNIIGGTLLSSGLFFLAVLALYQTNHPTLAIALAVITMLIGRLSYSGSSGEIVGWFISRLTSYCIGLLTATGEIKR